MSSEPATASASASASTASAPAAEATLCERGVIRSDLRNNPVMIKCGHCNQTSMTTTKGSFGAMSFGSAFALLFLFCPLIWLPFVLPSVSDFVIFHDMHVYCRCSLTLIDILRNLWWFSVKTLNILVAIAENSWVYRMRHVENKFWGLSFSG